MKNKGKGKAKVTRRTIRSRSYVSEDDDDDVSRIVERLELHDEVEFKSSDSDSGESESEHGTHCEQDLDDVGGYELMDTLYRQVWIAIVQYVQAEVFSLCEYKQVRRMIFDI